MQEVIVYQMGKVGSTSIVHSLNKAGIAAYQSHFLQPATFHQMIDRLASPILNDEQVSHMTEQLQSNLKLFNKIHRYRAANDQALGIITLVRDPLDWFYSNLSQNFFTIESPLRQWMMETGHLQQNQPITKEHIRRMIEEIFNCFVKLIPDMKKNHAPLMQQHYRMAGDSEEDKIYRFIYSQVSALLRPHFWLDIHLADFFPECDIYETFDNTTGSGQLHADNLQLLILRFEQLQNSHPIIAKFTDRPKFKMHRLNESKNKPIGRMVAEARSQVVYPQGFKGKLYTSHYARKFYPQCTS